MFVLGVDPGLARTGYGVVERRKGKPRAVMAGVISTDAGIPVAERLAELHQDLTALVAEIDVDAVAIEKVFVNKNLHTAASVGQASGVALLVAAQNGLPVFEYTPSGVKNAVAGDGAADKKAVQMMVTRLLDLAEAPKPADAADALAIALCHLQSHGLAAAIDKSGVV